VETLHGRSVEVARIVGSCRAARRLRPSVFQHSKALNFAISEFRGLERQGILGSLHRELPVHPKSHARISLFRSSGFGAARDFGVAASRTPGSRNQPAVGSGARWPESRWIKDTCTGLSPWEVHRKKDLGRQI
jgi:hypothetical protein